MQQYNCIMCILFVFCFQMPSVLVARSSQLLPLPVKTQVYRRKLDTAWTSAKDTTLNGISRVHIQSKSCLAIELFINTMSEVPMTSSTISVHEKTSAHMCTKSLTVMYGSLTTVDSVCHYCADVQQWTVFVITVQMFCILQNDWALLIHILSKQYFHYQRSWAILVRNYMP